MQPQRNPSGAEAEFKSPGKRQRRGAGGSPTTAAQQPSPSAQPQQQSPVAVSAGLQEAGGSNEGTLAAAAAAVAAGATGAAAAGSEAAATVTDAAKAFRELRVRPGRAPSPLRAGGGEQRERERGGGLPERPPSPKKRKASYNIDKEFILKDDKVKRNTDTQGDISQARGQLGQLLFEFSQIELNRDLLEAIKRTESKTGRSSGRPPAPGRLDRAAFELAVADATELLQAQLSSLEAHCQEPGLRSAILRSYAVQAIATFADEEGSSDDDDETSPGGTSSDDENADSNSRRQQRTGSSSQNGPSYGAQGRQGGALSGSAGSQDGMGAAAACEPHGGRRGRADWLPARPGSSSGGAMASPSRHVAVSTAEQASSSFLPDAPPESALEDTATAGQREQLAGAQRLQQQQEERQQQQQQGPLQGQRQQDDGDGMQQRMRMLSLEAEGSVQPQSSAAGGDEEDGPTDMVRSPAPVTSRRMPLPPTMPVGGAAGLAADLPQQSSGARRAPLLPAPDGEALEGGAGSRRASPAPDGEARMAAVLQEARQLALGASSFGQQRQAQRRQAQQVQQEQAAQQESSEGGSGGQASSAAPEPPKRQRRSGDLLPPVFEHSSQQRHAAAPRRASDPGATAAAAEQRAAILGSIHLQPGQEQQQQQQQQQAQQQAGAGAPAAGIPAQAGGAGIQQPDAAPADEAGQAPEAGPDGLASDATLRQGLPRAAHSGSSVWGSTLVCADLTVNDVASQYWPFLRSAMQGQAARLQDSDKALVAQLVKRLGETITDTYKAAAHSGRRPASEVCSLVAATAFDEYFRQTAAESSGASL